MRRSCARGELRLLVRAKRGRRVQLHPAVLVADGLARQLRVPVFAGSQTLGKLSVSRRDRLNWRWTLARFLRVTLSGRPIDTTALVLCTAPAGTRVIASDLRHAYDRSPESCRSTAP